MNKILEVMDFRVKFALREKELTVIRNVDFHLCEGETIAIVGESGSGKSVFTKALMGMLDKNGWIDNGIIKYNGEYIQNYTQKDWLRIRGSEIGMIFQDPMTALNPLKKIGVQISETLIYHMTKMRKQEAQKEINTLFQYNTPKTVENLSRLKTETEQIKEKITSLKDFRKNALKELKKTIKRYQNEAKNNKKINIVNSKHTVTELAKKAKKTGLNLDDEIQDVWTQLKKDNDAVEAQLQRTIQAINEEIPLIQHKIKDDNEELLRLEQQYNAIKAEYKTVKRQAKTEYKTNKQNDTEYSAKKEQVKTIKATLKNDLGLIEEQSVKDAVDFLDLVGIDRPEERYHQYPFELSGGMRQRVVIAVAMCTKPRILICDEPTTALDVTIQSQILQLIKDLQQQFGMSVIFITHDLGVVANVSDRVAVMYAGEIVEHGTAEEIFYNPYHPYTFALLKSLPQLGIKGEDLFTIQGTPPSFAQPIVGDAFAPRNPYAMKIDKIYNPPFYKISETHYAKTWLLHPQGQKNLQYYKKEVSASE